MICIDVLLFLGVIIMMKKVIYDCDNAMGIESRCIDDGMAIIYLSCHPSIDLLGISCTYGNRSVEDVYKYTLKLIREDLELEIPVLMGRDEKRTILDYSTFEYTTKSLEDVAYSDAAHFIVEQVRKYPYAVTILATGSMQNLYDAWKMDPSIVDLIEEVVVTGGITKPLVFCDKKLDEYNFSSFSEGAYRLFKSYKNVTVHSANNCMKMKFDGEDMDYILNKHETTGKNINHSFLLDIIKRSIDYYKLEYGCDEILLWDMAAAMYITDPDKFIEEFYTVISTSQDLSCGNLKFLNESLSLDESINFVNFPIAKNPHEINRIFMDTIFFESKNIDSLVAL